MRQLKRYEHTLYASYLGYITQAIVNNFAPLLFLTFLTDLDLTLDKVTLITTVNFAVQLGVDFLSARFVDRIGYRPCIVAAHVFSGAGLVGMAVFPAVLGGYAGLLLAVVLYAVGGGIIEVLISPIVEACPTQKKEAAMSLLHSFYCWGHVGVVLLSTLFFATVGIGHWRVMAVLWSLIPFANAVYFLLVPLYPIVQEGQEKMSSRKLFTSRVFWLLMVLMVCAGASEQAMSQWASAFAESALKVSKAVGDLAGPCAFALCMGAARALYGKFSQRLPLPTVMAACAGLCIGTYLVASLVGVPLLGLLACALCGFSVGIFWPGTFSIAAVKLPAAGTALYAMLALAGDVGCSTGPTLVGMLANANGGDLKIGLLFAVIFPALILLGVPRLKRAGAPGKAP